MTQAEMACCQQMKGDCDTQRSDHSCCAHATHADPAQTTTDNHLTVSLDFVTQLQGSPTEHILAISTAAAVLDLPPPPLANASFILRI